MDNQNQNPVTPPIPAVGTPTLQSDLPVSEIVSAMKNTPAPVAPTAPTPAPTPLQEVTPPTPLPVAPVTSAAPAIPVTTPAPVAPTAPTPAPTPNPLSENPDQVKTPGQ